MDVEPSTERVCPNRLPVEDSGPQTAELPLEDQISKCLDRVLVGWARYRKHCEIGVHFFRAVKAAALVSGLDWRQLLIEKRRGLRFTDPRWWTLRRLLRELDQPSDANQGTQQAPPSP
jgi:hypothetical protein